MIPKWPNFGSGIWVDFKNFCYWDIVLIYTCKNSIISSSSCVSCNGLGHDEVCVSSWWICDEFMTYFLFQLHSTPLSLFSTPCVGCEKLGITDQPIWFYFYWHLLQKENRLKKIFDNSTKMVFTKLIWDKLHKFGCLHNLFTMWMKFKQHYNWITWKTLWRMKTLPHEY
jgi:hypothetical protein